MVARLTTAKFLYPGYEPDPSLVGFSTVDLEKYISQNVTELLRKDM
jgi:hypothetical protein